MLYFFVAIGASAGSFQILQGCGWLGTFIALQLLVHLAVTLSVSRMLQLPLKVSSTSATGYLLYIIFEGGITPHIVE